LLALKVEEGTGVTSKGCRQLPETEKDKKKESSLESPIRKAAGRYLYFIPVRPMLEF
jgi:hypothetical protein